MATGMHRIAPCTRCGGFHDEGACLSWITAHDEGSVAACPQRHIHCARCDKGLTISRRHLQDSSPGGVVQTFIRTHTRCLPRRR